MILENGKFTHAIFTDKNKDMITAIWMDHDTEEYHEILIDVNLEEKNYKKLLESFDLREISEMTKDYWYEEEENFYLVVKDMALKHGLVYDPENADESDRLRIEHIFNPPEGEAFEDFLFNLKLYIFEQQEVVDSEDTELKRKLREAKTPLESLYIAGKFFYE
jgi:hypothetical protein